MITIIGLAVLTVLAGGMCLWALLTGDPPNEKVPQHARWVGEGETRPLDPPGRHRDGGL